MNSRYSRARAPSNGMPAVPERMARKSSQPTIGESIFDQIMTEMVTDPDPEDVAKRLREMTKAGPIVHGVDLRTWSGRKGTTFLHEFAKRGNTAACEILVKVGMDINVRRDDLCTALHMAAFGKKMDTMESLIMMGADETICNKWGESCRQLIDKAREELGRQRSKSSSTGNSRSDKEL